MPSGVAMLFQCATPHKQDPADPSRLGAGRRGFAAPFMAVYGLFGLELRS
jgi:hypothetical protein